MRTTIRSALALATLLALGGLPAVVQGQNSPVGPTWDCLLSGSGQQGIAFLTFSNRSITAYETYTNVLVTVTNVDESITTNFLIITNTAYMTNSPMFTGYQLLVGKQSAQDSADSEDGRNVGGGVGRGISSDGSASGGSGSTLFGFGFVNGPWRYDEKGRVVGYFVEILNQQTSIVTNELYETVTGSTWVYTTNADGTITTWQTNITVITTNISYVTNITGTTNSISFSAKVVPGKRLTLASSTPYGKVTYRGVPQKPLGAVIAGSWQGTKKENKQDFLEFFSMVPSDVANIYVIPDGSGPNLSFYGWSMVSVKKKIGFAFDTFAGVVTNFADVTGGKLSATYGPISYPKTKGTKANTKGYEDPMNRITFKAVRQGL